ncbi:DUF1036 domain-containing protein [Geminocystis sp. CENA526]|uniref:DUF1036 domain-containing protein n=1 Tax=Geminocystis sp. CENA526 TaxID=1355871 RepID=UPI003D6E45CC
MATPTYADLFCFPWERNCVRDGKVGTSRRYYTVHIHNAHNQTIWVAVSYRPDGGTSYDADIPTPIRHGQDPYMGWRTEGYWRLEPGQTALILGGNHHKIRHRYIYFHAHDANGNTWGGKDRVIQVRGREQPFFRSDMGMATGPGRYTHTFR